MPSGVSVCVDRDLRSQAHHLVLRLAGRPFGLGGPAHFFPVFVAHPHPADGHPVPARRGHPALVQFHVTIRLVGGFKGNGLLGEDHLFVHAHHADAPIRRQGLIFARKAVIQPLQRNSASPPGPRPHWGGAARMQFLAFQLDHAAPGAGYFHPQPVPQGRVER